MSSCEVIAQRLLAELDSDNDMVVRPTMRGIGLCSGVGWLDIAARLAWEWHGYRYRTVALVERDAYAAAVLLARMEDQSMERAAVSDSIEDIDERFAGVDCIVAGFPCQPWSVAGKGGGATDDRWIWPQIMECIERVNPSVVMLENVPGISRGSVVPGWFDRRGGLHQFPEDGGATGCGNVEQGEATAGDATESFRRFLVSYFANKPEMEGWDTVDSDGRRFVACPTCGRRLFEIEAVSGEVRHSDRVSSEGRTTSEEKQDNQGCEACDGIAWSADQEWKRDWAYQFGMATGGYCSAPRGSVGDSAEDIVWSGVSIVQRSLAEAGYAAEWLCLPAAAVGASHRRERWFCVAKSIQPRSPGECGAIGDEGRRRSDTHAAEAIRQDNGAAGPEGTNAGGSDMAESTQRGQRELREPSGGNGQPDGCDEVVADTTDAEGGRDKPQRGSDHRAAVGRAGEELDDSTGSRCSETVDGADERRASQRGRECVPCDGCGEMGHTEQSRPQRCRPSEPQRWDESVASNGNRRVFAPGPGSELWREVGPHLVPAIEPGVRVLADGSADFLDCAVSNWPRYVKLWEGAIKNELERLCGKKASPEGTSGDEVRVVHDRGETGRPPSRHQEQAGACDLSVQGMSCEGGSASWDSMEECQEVHSDQIVQDVSKASKRKQGQVEVLQPKVCNATQGTEAVEHGTRDAEGLLAMRMCHTGSDQKGSPVLFPSMRNDLPEFAVDMHRADQLRCSGNGVVVLQAATAFVHLLSRVLSNSVGFG